ncbi:MULTISPECIES: sensor histidine kinase [unclassified Gordonia (in: high G+C Gram-positive bacteria)]|uniref:sensor histidine kinase n=1 Tax=Gordonia sp. VNQ95 TaxID=3156619 RepID=UPI0032B39940
MRVRSLVPTWLTERTRGVRIRLTLVATTLVTVALTIAAVVLVLVLRHLLLHAADAATQSRAHEIAEVVQEQGIAGLDESLLSPVRNVDVVQVVDAEGTVVVSSLNHSTTPLGPGVDAGSEITVDDATTSPSGSEYRATLLGVDTPDGPVTVEVGALERPIDWLVLTAAVVCCIVFPIIVIGMALMTYYFVGRALKPVDLIRGQVEEISGGDLHQRVPVPGTGDEIATLATTMNDMLDRIETARAQQMRFVNDASHELNSPLTTLVGLLDLSRSKHQPLDPETVDSVLLPEALRLQSMVSDLLLLARADESGVPLRITDVDLDEICTAEVNRLEALGRHHVEARIVAVRVRGDAEKLSRALRNLADNAARHTRDRLTLAMTLSDDGARVSVTVADNGPGIPDADKDRVTERFVRLDNTRERRWGGSGLGLAIVSEIIRAHDGEVRIADTPGGGATVGFILPVQPWHSGGASEHPRPGRVGRS